MFTIIAAIGRSNELGRDNNIIWHLPTDMKFFRETTKGHTIIMGHNTFDSLGGLLPDRHHVVITHAAPETFPEEVEVVHSFVEAYQTYHDSDEEVFVIGGGEIYRLFYSYANRMYLTHINEIYFNAQVFFPKINETDWDIKTIKSFEENGVSATIKRYDRKIK